MDLPPHRCGRRYRPPALPLTVSSTNHRFSYFPPPRPRATPALPIGCPARLIMRRSGAGDRLRALPVGPAARPILAAAAAFACAAGRRESGGAAMGPR